MSDHKVLLTWFNHPDNRPLNVDPLVNEVKEILTGTHWEVTREGDLGTDRLQELLRQERPAVLHLVSHGEVGGLHLKGEAGGPRRTDAVGLANLITGSGHVPELIVLAACNSAHLAGLLRTRGVGMVIFSKEEISDGSLDAFARGFYKALRDGADYLAAFRAGLTLVEVEDRGERNKLDVRYDEEAPLAPRPPPKQHAVRGHPNLTQLLVAMDIDDQQPSQQEIERFLPATRRGVVEERATEHGAPRLDRDRAPRDVRWQAVGEGLAALAAKVKATARQRDPSRIYVWGNAPLAAAAALGHRLGSWTQEITLIHYRRFDGRFEVLHLDHPARPGPPVFDRVEGLDTVNPAEGRLGVYVSTFGDAPPDSVREHLGEGAAGLVSLCTSARRTLEAEHYLRAREELVAAWSDLATCWPRAGEVVLYLRVPLPLAFLAGRAINVKVKSPVLLVDHGSKVYYDALRLP